MCYQYCWCIAYTEAAFMFALVLSGGCKHMWKDVTYCMCSMFISPAVILPFSPFLFFTPWSWACWKTLWCCRVVISSICWPLTPCYGCEVGTAGGRLVLELAEFDGTSVGEEGINGSDAVMTKWPNSIAQVWRIHPTDAIVRLDTSWKSGDSLGSFDVDTIFMTVAVRRYCAVWCYLSAVHKLISTVILERLMKHHQLSCSLCFNLNFSNRFFFCTICLEKELFFCEESHSNAKRRC